MSWARLRGHHFAAAPLVALTPQRRVGACLHDGRGVSSDAGTKCKASRVPFMLYRSGTSRGAFVLENDVPEKGPMRDAVLCKLMGSGHPQQLEGLGGGVGPTSKAVVVGSGEEEGSVTYTFSQCRVAEASVDHSHGDCGNMLAAVGPFAVERGLVAAKSDLTHVRIRSLVTGAVYSADVLTVADHSGELRVRYDGDYEVPNVPNPAAPVVLTTFNVAGSQTCKLLPSGRAVEQVDLGDGLGEVSATVVDFARALIILDANEVLPKFGYTSIEVLTKKAIEQDTIFNKALNNARRALSIAIGMGDCVGKDAPKIAIVGKHNGGSSHTLACRYWVNPERNELHPSMAMTAAQALAAGALLKDSVVRRVLAGVPQADVSVEAGTSFSFHIAHERGILPVTVGVRDPRSDTEAALFPWDVPDAGKYTTTVMPIVDGHAFI